MTPPFKIAAAVLIAILTCASLASQQFPLPEKIAAHNGGCHGDGRSAPSQAPAHHCCLSGHDVAIRPLSQAQRPDVQRNLRGEGAIVAPHAIAPLHSAEVLPISPVSESPGTVPLRI